MKSATTLVGEALEQGECLTSLEALQRFGLHHLASTVRRLKAKGMQIETEMIELANGKLIARYRIPAAQSMLILGDNRKPSQI